MNKLTVCLVALNVLSWNDAVLAAAGPFTGTAGEGDVELTWQGYGDSIQAGFCGIGCQDDSYFTHYARSAAQALDATIHYDSDASSGNVTTQIRGQMSVSELEAADAVVWEAGGNDFLSARIGFRSDCNIGKLEDKLGLDRATGQPLTPHQGWVAKWDELISFVDDHITQAGCEQTCPPASCQPGTCDDYTGEGECTEHCEETCERVCVQRFLWWCVRWEDECSTECEACSEEDCSTTCHEGALVRTMNVYYPGVATDMAGRCGDRSHFELFFPLLLAAGDYMCSTAWERGFDCADTIWVMNCDSGNIANCPTTHAQWLALGGDAFTGNFGDAKAMGKLQGDDIHPNQTGHREIGEAHHLLAY